MGISQSCSTPSYDLSEISSESPFFKLYKPNITALWKILDSNNITVTNLTDIIINDINIKYPDIFLIFAKRLRFKQGFLIAHTIRSLISFARLSDNDFIESLKTLGNLHRSYGLTVEICSDVIPIILEVMDNYIIDTLKIENDMVTYWLENRMYWNEYVRISFQIFTNHEYVVYEPKKRKSLSRS